MSDIVRVTPLLGGKSEGAVCSLLEIGGSRILLDCGGIVDFDFTSLLNIANELVSGGGIDAVVIRYCCDTISAINVLKKFLMLSIDQFHHCISTAAMPTWITSDLFR